MRVIDPWKLRLCSRVNLSIMNSKEQVLELWKDNKKINSIFPNKDRAYEFLNAKADYSPPAIINQEFMRFIDKGKTDQAIPQSSSMNFSLADAQKVETASRNLLYIQSHISYCILALLAQANNDKYVPSDYSFWTRTIQSFSKAMDDAASNILAIGNFCQHKRREFWVSKLPKDYQDLLKRPLLQSPLTEKNLFNPDDVLNMFQTRRDEAQARAMEKLSRLSSLQGSSPLQNHPAAQRKPQTYAQSQNRKDQQNRQKPFRDDQRNKSQPHHNQFRQPSNPSSEQNSKKGGTKGGSGKFFPSRR